MVLSHTPEVAVLAMSPHPSGTIVAVDARGAVWRGEAAGEWRKVFRIRPRTAAPADADPVEEDPGEGEAVEPPPVAARAVAFDPRVEGRVFIAAGTEGLWRSEDDGESWRRMALAGEVWCVAPGAELLAGTDAGVLASSDGGEHWRRVELPGPGTGAGAGAGVVALALAADGTLFEGRADGLRIRSSKGGPVTVGQDQLPGAIRSILLSPEGAEVWVSTDSGLFRSRDGGLHFQSFGDGQNRQAVALWPGKPGVLLAATPTGVERLDEGGLEVPMPEVPVPQIRDQSFYADGLGSWRRGAGIAALLPEVSLEYRVETSHGTPHVLYQTTTNRISIFPGLRFIPFAGDEFVVSASWNFDQLLASANLSRALLGLSRHRRARERQFARLSRMSVEQKQLEARLAAGIDDPDERLSAQLRIEEITALLEASHIEISPR